MSFSPVTEENGLRFLEWLGIDIPDEFRKGLSCFGGNGDFPGDYLLKIIRMLSAYCEDLQVPYGINIESIIARKAETSLALDIAEKVSDIFIKI